MAEYPISVKTPFGTFSGTIDINIDGSAVSGSFSIIGLSSAFSGEAGGAGVSFAGSLETPAGEIAYSASGAVSPEGFSGIAETRLGAFEFAPPYRGRRRRKA